MRDLLAALTHALDAGRPCVVCSLVETRGSTPQKAGAAMLVFNDGSQAGTLGGGCVEAEVKRQALRTLADDAAHAPQILSFCLDDNYGWDDGLICGGRMTILADPLRAGNDRAAYFHRFRQIVDQGTGCTEAIPSQAILDAPLLRFNFVKSYSRELGIGEHAERDEPISCRAAASVQVVTDYSEIVEGDMRAT